MRDEVAGHDGAELSEGFGNTSPAVDWEQHLYGYGDGLLCEFRPRAEYKGRAIKAGMTEKTGTLFFLRAMWLMHEDDSYPGEYALSTVDSCGGLMDTLGIDWVASGDVVVLPNAQVQRA